MNFIKILAIFGRILLTGWFVFVGLFGIVVQFTQPFDFLTIPIIVLGLGIVFVGYMLGKAITNYDEVFEN